MGNLVTRQKEVPVNVLENNVKNVSAFPFRTPISFITIIENKDKAFTYVGGSPENSRRKSQIPCCFCFRLPSGTLTDELPSKRAES